MNLQYIQGLWEEQRMVWGISLRVFQAIPKDKMDAHPIPGMRTPKELIAHMGMMMHAIPTGIAKGKIEAYEDKEKEAVDRRAKLYRHRRRHPPKSEELDRRQALGHRSEYSPYRGGRVAVRG
jgi:hypothetical protein